MTIQRNLFRVALLIFLCVPAMMSATPDGGTTVDVKETPWEGSVEFFIPISKAALPGDVNGDGKVTVTDVLMIIDKAQGKSPEPFDSDAADLNNDGAVTFADAVQALGIVLDSSE